MKRIAVGLWMLAVAAGAFAQSGEKLGAGDAVRVTVFQQPDLTTETRITEKGMVTLPLVGELKLAGLSVAAAGSEIAQAFKRGKFLNNPQVSVALVTLRSRQVSVLGMVARPGRYPLDESSSRLSDVIAAAGGITETGADVATVIRDGEEYRVSVLGKPFELKGGETVHVDRAPTFYIYGEVTRAGAYRLEPNMTVMQALAAGGGITPRGSDRRLKLRRTGPDGKPVEADAGLRDLIKPNDVIYVRESLF